MLLFQVTILWYNCVTSVPHSVVPHNGVQQHDPESSATGNRNSVHGNDSMVSHNESK